MPAFASIFLEIRLPNPTTWFYFSSLLTVAMQPPHAAKNSGETPTPTPPTPLEKEVPRQVEKIAAQQLNRPDLGPLVLKVLALLCHLTIAVGLVLVGWKHFDDVVAG